MRCIPDSSQKKSRNDFVDLQKTPRNGIREVIEKRTHSQRKKARGREIITTFECQRRLVAELSRHIKLGETGFSKAKE